MQESKEVGTVKFICGRCYEEVSAVFDPDCKEKPEDISGPIGMYHCPDCGTMIVAGMRHPRVCGKCLAKEHSGIDATDNRSKA